MSLAALREERVLSPTLDEWVRQPDVSARLVHFDQNLFQGLDQTITSIPVRSANTIKSGSSMATTFIHQSNASTHPPSLRSFCTNTDGTPTETSISTGLASRFTGVPLLEEHNGVLEIPPAHFRAPVYECAFWFLNCAYVSQNREEWETHCTSHFRGEEPPQTVHCPLCDWAATCEFGWTAWNMRMQHLAFEHTMRGQTLRTSRPDFDLFRFLWQRRLIDDQDLKELNGGNHNLTHPPGNFVETNGRRRDRNGRRHRTQQVRVPRPPPPHRP
ncbi:hypothetical protein BDW02DRAFT_583234 [Decorospora gaudefroyi]|uniref:Uncharacterized protein n=1 Tax=Decorospora gaudefroyi TaxID=184978 RepID=A0A6A5K691_9PLEO|nr:hypothetical protein BDW02DRAFT_583234 [Decorospora gaudefroyi]